MKKDRTKILSEYVREAFRLKIGFGVQETFTGIKYARLKDVYIGALSDADETMKWLRGMDELSIRLREMVQRCEAELKGEKTEKEFDFGLGE